MQLCFLTTFLLAQRITDWETSANTQA